MTTNRRSAEDRTLPIPAEIAAREQASATRDPRMWTGTRIAKAGSFAAYNPGRKKWVSRAARTLRLQQRSVVVAHAPRQHRYSTFAASPVHLSDDQQRTSQIGAQGLRRESAERGVIR